MTVSIQTPTTSYTGNGSTKIFPYTFKISQSTDLQVFIQGVLQSTGYTISGVGNNAGGNVTFTVAPIAGTSIVLRRSTSLERQTDYLTAGKLNADTLDADIDRVVLMVQDLRRDVGEGEVALAESVYLNIKSAGAIGNGTTDDTAAIQLAIDSAAGKAVFIPEGTFIVSSLSLPSNTTILGYGESSILKMKDSQPDGTWVFKNSNFTTGNTGIRLANFVIDGNDDNQTLGFNNTCTQFQKVNGIVLKDMIIRNGISEGVYLYNCANPIVVDNKFEGNGPWHGDASGLHLDSCTNAVVANNQASGNGFHGMIFTGTTISTISNNVCTGNGYEGIRVQWSSSNNTFSNNVCTGNGRNGIYLLTGSDDNIISNNILNGNDNDGIAFNDSKNNRLGGNQIKGNENNGVETVLVTDVNYWGENDIRDNVTNQFYHDGAAVQIFSNAFSSITSKPTTLAGYGITDGALSTHNHDSSYSSISHNHDSSYSAIGHNHDSTYSAISHDHTGIYQPVGSYLTGNQTITLSGDATGSGTTSISVALNTVPISKGGTGQTTATDALNALLPSQTGNSGKFLTTNGITSSWSTVSSGSSTLSTLTDVTITSLADKDILSYSSASSKWINKTPSVIRTDLGLVIGTNVQAWDADLDAIAGLSGTSGFLKTNGAGTWTVDTNTYSLSSHDHSSTYEPVISSGTTAQYWRGDKSWVALDKTAVGLSAVENTALSTWAGSTNITSLGTVTTGTFSGTLGAISGASLTNLNGSNISSGTVPVARLGSGTPSGSNFLRGDGSWAAVTASPAGISTSIQYNAAGTTAGSNALMWNYATYKLNLNAANAEIHIGSLSGGVGNNPGIAFHSSGNGTHDAYIYADSGTGATDGDLYFQSGNEFHYSNVTYLSTTAADMMVRLRTPAGQERYLEYTSGTSTRWRVGTNNIAEGGSNAGSDFFIKSYTDAGALLETPLSINRATGAVNIKQLDMPELASIGTPAAGTLSVGHYDVAKMSKLYTKNAQGVFAGVQDDIVDGNIAFWQPPGNSTTVPGVIGIAAPTAVGTVTARNIATTNLATRVKRLGYVSAATAGSLAGHYSTVAQYTTGGAAGGGFLYSCIFVMSSAAALTTKRAFIGMSSSVAAPTNVEPSTLTNCVGVAKISSSQNLQIVYGGSAAQTAIDLGSDFPADSLSTAAYRLTLYFDPSVNNSVGYQVDRLGTAFTATGTLTGTAGTALPANTTLLAHRAWVCNNAAAQAVGIDIGTVYIEMFL